MDRGDGCGNVVEEVLMGEAKKRGNFEDRRALAIELRKKFLGKRVRTDRLGEGVIHDVRHDQVTIRFCGSGRTIEVVCPLSFVLGMGE